jgi:hypothetical protein
MLTGGLVNERRQGKRHTGQRLWLCSALIRQTRQNVCPHAVETGSKNSRRHKAQFSSSIVTMLRETLAMMSQDERLSAQEVQWAIKWRLACKLRKSPVLPKLRISEQKSLVRFPSLRSHSPEVSGNWQKRPQSMQSMKLSTPKLSASAEEMCFPDEFHLSRSASRADRRSKLLCTC